MILLLLACWARAPGRAVLAELSGPLPVLDREEPGEVVELVLGLRLGSAMDPVGAEGLAALSLRSALLGLVALDTGADGPDLGRELRMDIGPERALLVLRCLPDEAAICARRLSDLVVEPRWSASAVELARVRTEVDHREALASDPALLLDTLMESRVYAGHPYGHPVEGRPAALRWLQPEAPRRFFQQRAVRGAVVLGLRGPSTAELAVELQAALAALPMRTVVPTTPRRPRPPGGRALLGAQVEEGAAALGLGAAVDLDPRGADALALGLGIAALDGPDGRLAAALDGWSGSPPRALLVRRGREQPSWRLALDGPGAPSLERLGLVLRELERLAAEGLTESELERLRARELAGLAAIAADPSASLQDEVERRLLGWPSAEKEAALLRAIGGDVVARALRRHLDPGNLWIVALGEAPGPLEALEASPVPGSTQRPGPASSLGISFVHRGPALELLP